MQIFRSYFEKQATLLRNNLSNNSRNPVIELSYGGSMVSGQTDISRYIFKLNLTDLNNKIISNELSISNIISHKINIKNVISLSNELIGKNFISSKRGSGVDVILFYLDEDFDEGTGYDYIYNTNSITNYELNTSAANWFYRKHPNIQWNEVGLFTGLTSNNIISNQRLELGNEDLIFDVTDYINNILFSGQTHYGFGICYSANTEAYTNENKYVITFFSKYTNTFFEPFLETKFDNVIKDNRYKFYLDENNKLYFKTNKIIDTLDKVQIFDYNNELYETYTGNNINRVNKDTFYININVPSYQYPDLVNFTDRWIYTINNIQYTYDNEFTLLTNDHLFDDDFYNKEFYFSFTGIKHNEVINNKNGNKRIQINSKRLYNSSVKEEYALENLQYRLYTLQGFNTQINIVEWTDVNILNNKNYFDFDVSWLIPSDYYLELRVLYNNFEYKNNKPIKFKIVNEI